MKYSKLSFLSALLVLSVGMFSCQKEYETIEELDDSKIRSYIQSSGLTNMTRESNGVYSQVSVMGTNGAISNSDSVLFTIKITDLTGKVLYDTPPLSNTGEYLGYLSSQFPTSLTANVPYPGDVFRSAISKVERGSVIKLIIPSHAGYGRAGNSLVEPNGIIVVDLNILPYKSQADLDDFRIREYLTANNISALKHSSGAYYQLITEGSSGLPAKLYNLVKTKFKARTLDGFVFDQTIGDTLYETELGSTRYFGLRKLLENRKAGTKMRIFLPSRGALGAYGSADVPKNSSIDIELELVEVVDDDAETATPTS